MGQAVLVRLKDRRRLGGWRVAYIGADGYAFIPDPTSQCGAGLCVPPAGISHWREMPGAKS